MTKIAVETQALTHRFGNFTAVDNVDLAIPEKTIYGFLGPNGCGKSTIMRLITGLLTPSSGMINVLGMSIPQEAEALRLRIGYMTQKFSLYEDLTVIENMRFIAEIYNPQEYKDYIFNGKFDYLYDKVGMYDALKKLMQGYGDANEITRIWQHESGDFANHMIRFLENHDEQRIASKYFAGDGFKAIPAMVVSATLHKNPIMLYFGQEVGVNPTQAEGFSGEDGRTTIFDYWGVPEFQNWVNDHKYDGGKLTIEQKKLRNFYEDLNHFIVKNEAIKLLCLQRH